MEHGYLKVLKNINLHEEKQVREKPTTKKLGRHKGTKWEVSLDWWCTKFDGF